MRTLGPDANRSPLAQQPRYPYVLPLIGLLLSLAGVGLSIVALVAGPFGMWGSQAYGRQPYHMIFFVVAVMAAIAGPITSGMALILDRPSGFSITSFITSLLCLLITAILSIIVFSIFVMNSLNF